MEEIARFPLHHLTVKAEFEQLLAGRLVTYDGKSDQGDYKARHAAAGATRVMGCVQRDTVDPKAEPKPSPFDAMLRTDIVRSDSIARVLCVGEVEDGDEVACVGAGKVGSIEAAVAAHVDTGTVGENNGITWTAVDAGALGNALSVTLVDPAGNNKALAVDVDGTEIVVSLATDAEGKITSTAAQVIAAVLEHDTASQLVTAANKGASNGTGKVKAVAETALAGGAAGAGEDAIGMAFSDGKDSIIEVEIY